MTFHLSVEHKGNGNIKTLRPILCLLPLLACATYVTPTPYYYTNTQNFDVPRMNASVHISEEDLSKREYRSYGLIGLLFPVAIDSGKLLKDYSDVYFDKMFEKIVFNRPFPGAYDIYIEMQQFEVSGFQSPAHLTLNLSVKDGTEKTIFQKTYHADGPKHKGLYFDESDQQEHVEHTTKIAFQTVFSEIADDFMREMPTWKTRAKKDDDASPM